MTAPNLAGSPSQDSSLDDRLRVVQEMVNLFKLERMVYLISTIVSLLMLLASGGYLIVTSHADPAALTLIFGSSGLIGYSANRLLRMWDQSMKMMMMERK